MGKTLCVYHDEDRETEKELYKKGIKNKLIKRKQLYKNLFNLVSEYDESLRLLGFKIAYGYLRVTDDIYLRTSVFVRDHEVVDINRRFYQDQEGGEYYIFDIMTIEEYAGNVLKSKGDLTLTELLKDKEEAWGRYVEYKGITKIL